MDRSKHYENKKPKTSSKQKYKKMKKIIIAILFLLLIPITLGCSKSTIPDRKITITTEKEIIDNIIIGEDQNYEKIFVDHISGGKISEVKLGDKIVLDFGEKAPDYIVIKEWILFDKEGAVYTDNIIKNHEYYEEGNGSYYFTVDENLLAKISKEAKEANGMYLGIKIEAKWEFDRETYVLVCKTSQK